MMDAHACISKSPSGSHRAAIGFGPVGSACRNCGVTIQEKHILPKAPETTAPPKPKEEVYHAHNKV